MCPHVYAVREFNLCAVVVFFSLAIYLHAGIKEMVVCKVLSQGIPHRNKTNLNESCLAKRNPK